MGNKKHLIPIIENAIKRYETLQILYPKTRLFYEAKIRAYKKRIEDLRK